MAQRPASTEAATADWAIKFAQLEKQIQTLERGTSHLFGENAHDQSPLGDVASLRKQLSSSLVSERTALFNALEGLRQSVEATTAATSSSNRAKTPAAQRREKELVIKARIDQFKSTQRRIYDRLAREEAELTAQLHLDREIDHDGAFLSSSIGTGGGKARLPSPAAGLSAVGGSSRRLVRQPSVGRALSSSSYSSASSIQPQSVPAARRRPPLAMAGSTIGASSFSVLPGPANAAASLSSGQPHSTQLLSGKGSAAGTTVSRVNSTTITSSAVKPPVPLARSATSASILSQRDGWSTAPLARGDSSSVIRSGGSGVSRPVSAAVSSGKLQPFLSSPSSTAGIGARRRASTASVASGMPAAPPLASSAADAADGSGSRSSEAAAFVAACRQLEEELAAAGGATGGWPREDHDVFARVITRYRRHNQHTGNEDGATDPESALGLTVSLDTLLPLLSVRLPSYSRQDLVTHLAFLAWRQGVEARRRGLLKAWKAWKEEAPQQQWQVDSSEDHSSEAKNDAAAASTFGAALVPLELKDEIKRWRQERQAAERVAEEQRRQAEAQQEAEREKKRREWAAEQKARLADAKQAAAASSSADGGSGGGSVVTDGPRPHSAPATAAADPVVLQARAAVGLVQARQRYLQVQAARQAAIGVPKTLALGQHLMQLGSEGGDDRFAHIAPDPAKPTAAAERRAQATAVERKEAHMRREAMTAHSAPVASIPARMVGRSWTFGV